MLNGATFAELDAAEQRLLLAGYQAGLLANMTPEARRIVAFLDEQASAIRIARKFNYSENPNSSK